MNPLQEANIRLEQAQECSAQVVTLNNTKITLQLAPSTEASSFMWVKFEIPNQGGSCNALCEVIESANQRVRVRFKHIFPNERLALERALNTDTESEIAVA